MGKLYGLTEADRDKLRRLSRSVGAGKAALSQRPVPTRRRVVPSARGSAGASGTFLCVLDDDMAAAAGVTTPATQTGTVYEITGPGGTTTSIGTRDIYWHGMYPLSDTGRYLVAKTYDDETDSDDEFTIVGVIYPGYGAAKQALTHAASSAPPMWEDIEVFVCPE